MLYRIISKVEYEAVNFKKIIIIYFLGPKQDVKTVNLSARQNNSIVCSA